MKNSIFINLINTDCLILASSLSGRNKSFEPGVVQRGKRTGNILGEQKVPKILNPKTLM